MAHLFKLQFKLCSLINSNQTDELDPPIGAFQSPIVIYVSHVPNWISIPTESSSPYIRWGTEVMRQVMAEEVFEPRTISAAQANARRCSGADQETWNMDKALVGAATGLASAEWWGHWSRRLVVKFTSPTNSLPTLILAKLSSPIAL